MKVVFLENVPQVANAGEVKDVADGYGRNYLIPRKLAVVASGAALKQLESQREAAGRKAARLESEAEQLARKLEGRTVAISMRVGGQGRLYGSVTNADVARELESIAGQPIDRRRVMLHEPIRRLGSYPVSIRLTSELSATVTVNVRAEGAPEGEAAPAAAAPAEPPAAEAAASEEDEIEG